MIESRRIFDRRAREEEADAELEDFDEAAEVFVELLIDAMKKPMVRTAICNIVAADARSKSKPKPPAPVRGARRA